MLLRHTFAVGGGWSHDLSVSVAIDNDIQIWVNGTELTSGLTTHENCATRDSFVFTIPSSLLVTGNNVLAIRARDRGVDALVDAQLTAKP